jgi:hypothetical protein
MPEDVVLDRANRVQHDAGGQERPHSSHAVDETTRDRDGRVSPQHLVGDRAPQSANHGQGSDRLQPGGGSSGRLLHEAY